MRIINYRIIKPVHVKTEVTKLTALPIENSSSSYYLAIPMIINDLPSDVIFITETLLIAPNTTENYVPKLLKVGASIGGNYTTLLSKGVQIRIIIIDTITDELAITHTSSYKATGRSDNMTVSPMLPMDSMKIAEELMQDDNLNLNETKRLLQIIDSKKARNDDEYEDPDDDSGSDNEQSTATTIDPSKVFKVVVEPNPKKRGRPKGSPNKKKLVVSNEVLEEAASLLASSPEATPTSTRDNDSETHTNHN